MGSGREVCFCGLLRLLIAVRDTKREGMLVGGTNRTHVVKYDIEIGKDNFLQARFHGLSHFSQRLLNIQRCAINFMDISDLKVKQTAT